MRFLYHALRGWLKPRPTTSRQGLQPFKTHVFKTRAGIFDIDVNMHLNNASLVLATEFARWNFIAGTDLGKAAVKNRWAFMVGAQAVRYRHEVRAFHAFEVKTDLVAADSSWLWLRHVVYSSDRQCAHVLVRVIIKNGRDTVPPTKILELIGVDPTTVPLPETSTEVKGFLEWDADAAAQMKAYALAKS